MVAWTGTAALVYGGRNFGDLSVSGKGASFDPAAGKWSSLPDLPLPRDLAAFVWTGDALFVWGGNDTATAAIGSGAILDWATRSWRPVSDVGAPGARSFPGAVWTGKDVLVFGGLTKGGQADGGASYSPATDRWTPLPEANAPSARSGHSMVWTGSSLIVWSGEFDNDGAVFDPVTGKWTPTSRVGAPSARGLHFSAWTGESMIVVGGETADGSFELGDGGEYHP